MKMGKTNQLLGVSFTFNTLLGYLTLCHAYENNTNASYFYLVYCNEI